MGAIDLENKFIGAMIGSALGDAIGELAFRYPQEALLGSALNQASLLRYTDDTAMAIGLAESIIEKKSIHEEDRDEKNKTIGAVADFPCYFYRNSTWGRSFI